MDELPLQGALSVCVTNGKNCDPQVAYTLNVAHGESEGECGAQTVGTEPLFNRTLDFEYEADEAIYFTLSDASSGAEVAQGKLYTDMIFRHNATRWEGDVPMGNGASLYVTVIFQQAPRDPPPRISVLIRQSKDFDKELVGPLRVEVGLDCEKPQFTKIAEPSGVHHLYHWDELLDFEYEVEKKLTLSLQTPSGTELANANFDLWIIQDQGKLQAFGSLPIAHPATQVVLGAIDVGVHLYDPAKAVPSPPVSAEECPAENVPELRLDDPPVVDEPAPMVDPPAAAAAPDNDQLGTSPSRDYGAYMGAPDPSPRRFTPADEAKAEEAARRAAADADAAQEMAKAGAVAAGLRPEAALDSARKAADKAEGAEKNADEAKAAVQAMKNGTLYPEDAREDAEREAEKAKANREAAAAAAMTALRAAGEAALRDARDAVEKAQKAAMAVAALRAANADDGEDDGELKRLSDEVRELAAKATQQQKKCEEACEKLRKAETVGEALACLEKTDESARNARKRQIEAEELARLAAKHAKKLEKEAAKREKLRLQFLKDQLKEQDRLNRLERQREAELEAERRKTEEVPLRERAVFQDAAAADFRGYGALEPDFMTENGIAPAACCYIPPNRSKLLREKQEQIYGVSDDAFPHDYPYDVAAYGVPAPELGILIEGEMQNPTCCMCCGIRWNKC